MATLPTGWDREIKPEAPEIQLQDAITNSPIAPKRTVRIILDGKIHRFAVEGDKNTEKAGWYIGFGDNIPAGMFGSWRGSVESKWLADVGRELTAEEIAVCERRMAEAAAIRDEERRKYREQIASAVMNILKTVMSAAPEHPYLQRKQVGVYGIYQTGDGRLMIPIILDGRIASAQYIAADGQKQFHGGGEVKGGYYPLGPLPPQEGPLYIAEGYATAASIHEATGNTVIIALNAGNLPPVAKWLREKLGPVQEIVIVGDNDESGTGQAAANEAATIIGARVILPPEIGDVNDYVTAGGDLKALLTGKSAWLTQADDFCAKPAPIRWLIKKWIQAGGLAMVYGDSGTGKTFVVLDWVLRMAAGVETWAGLRVRPGGVIYLAGEGHYGLKARIAGWKQYHKVEHLNAWVSGGACDLNTPEGLAKTISEIRALEAENVAVIVVDTLHRFLIGDENKATDTKTMLDACSKLSQTFDCTVILVHHTGVNQEAKGRARGSSAWRGALDNQILVTSSGDNIKLEQVKQKDSELADSVYLERIPAHLPGWFDEDGEPVSTIVLEPDEHGGEKEIKALSKNSQRALQAYREAAEKVGLLDEHGEFAGVQLEEWRKTFYKNHKGKSQRQDFNKAIKDLTEKGDLIKTNDIFQMSEDYELEKVYIKKKLQNIASQPSQ
ncbi:AAA family ATPase [Cloacibacillus evryensis]|uniref:AAA family ATPase n=1 Tax=Cloacibacillus evryensis TaxID=508460 RepID=UPI0004AE24D0|nr:AAA family ATPase [Cloacibacillus evryensis]